MRHLWRSLTTQREMRIVSSLGQCKLSDEVMKDVITRSGREYNSGQSYDIKFRGPDVKVLVYDETGVQVDAISFREEEYRQVDWTEEKISIARLHEANKRKQLIFIVFCAIVGVSTAFALILSFYLGGV